MKKLITVYTVAIVLLLGSSVGGASDEYFLGYRVSSDIDEEVWCSSGSVKPQDKLEVKPTKQPSFASQKPLYFTIELQKQKFLLVLDESKGTGKGYDTLYFDTNRNGDLTDDEKHTAKEEWFCKRFGPMMALIESEKGKMAYHFGFESYKFGEEEAHYTIKSNCLYSGKVKFGPKTHKVAIVDSNCNGLFNDKMSGDIWGCDWLFVDINDDGRFDRNVGSSKEAYPYANYILVDGKYYSPEVSSLGYFFRLREAKPKMGVLKAKQEEFTIGLAGSNGLFILNGQDFMADVPAGSYTLFSTCFKGKDASGNEWEIRGRSDHRKSRPSVEIKAEGVADFSFGPPFSSTLSYKKTGGNVYKFDIKITGQAGEIYSDVKKNDKRAPAPSLKVESEDGKFSTRANFRYG